MATVEVDKLGGTEGTFQVMEVNGVVVVPVPNTVGLKQVKVGVVTVALTFGATVF